MAVFLLVAMVVLSRQAAVYTLSVQPDKKITVVIDVGHGGCDPGKVGVGGILEKDINLAVALKLETLLKQTDMHVVLTRKTGKWMYNIRYI